VNKLKLALGTGLYSGLLPKAPGTAGSIAAVLIIYVFIYTDLFFLLPVFVLVSCLLSLWVAGYFEDIFGKDPGRMVIDEWAGQGLTFLFIPFSGDVQSQLLILLIGFIFFRFFDILKPLGIKKLQDLPAGWGILADDLLAGLYALICLKTLIFVLPNIFEMA
jgi:phosphatidylglycerophosphatase A